MWERPDGFDVGAGPDEGFNGGLKMASKLQKTAEKSDFRAKNPIDGFKLAHGQSWASMGLEKSSTRLQKVQNRPKKKSDFSSKRFDSLRKKMDAVASTKILLRLGP